MSKLFTVPALLGLAISLSVALSTTAHATPVVGSAELGFIGVDLSLGEIDWTNPSNPGFGFGPTYGTMNTVITNNTGFFAGPAFGVDGVNGVGVTLGLLRDISGNVSDGNGTNASVFLYFYAQPGWYFKATHIAPGRYASTPVSFVQNGNDVDAIIMASGWVCDTAGPANPCAPGDDVSNWTASFTGKYGNTSIAALDAALLGGGHILASNWRGNINVTAIVPDDDGEVPEPASLTLVGLALAGMGAARRRKVRSDGA